MTCYVVQILEWAQTQPPILWALVETRHGHKTKTTKQGTNNTHACTSSCMLLLTSFFMLMDMVSILSWSSLPEARHGHGIDIVY